MRGENEANAGERHLWVLRLWGWGAVLAAALLAGPWPQADTSSLLWRAPLALAAGILGVRLAGPRLLLLCVPVAGALAVDAVIPGTEPAERVSSRAGATVRRFQNHLGGLAEGQEVKRLLATSGGEVEPETAFTELDVLCKQLPVRVEALVLVDERGRPVAWSGHRPRTPLRLRSLGERTTVVEPGLGEVWLWWREPVLEGGRTQGGLLAGCALSEQGSRSLVGVTAGREAVIVPKLEGGTPLRAPDGARLMGIEVARGRASWWSPPGAAVAVALVAVAWGVGGWVGALILLAVASGAVAAEWLSSQWWLVVGLLGAAWGLSRLRALIDGRGGVGDSASSPASDAQSQKVESRTRSARVLGWALSVGAAAAVGTAATQLPMVIREGGLRPVPGSLLAPSFLSLALVASLTLLLLAIPKPGGGSSWVLGVGSWVLLIVGFLQAEPVLLGAGTGLVALLGLPGRRALLAAAAAGTLLAGSSDAARRSGLVAITDDTLSRLEGVERPAQALLTSLPAAALEDVMRLSHGERLTILGRLAGWLGLAELLPGAALVIAAPDGEVAALWEGAAVLGNDSRELAYRDLRAGWRLAVMVPAEPHDLLAALASRGVSVPTAVFDRSGAPVARGAIFRPLSPGRVGRALAEARSWGVVEVGERRHLAYLRSHQDGVLAVPWIRPPLSEAGLILAGLALWGALPVALWLGRRRWRDVWQQRRTFTGRLVVLAATVALLPVLLLSQLLPRQWSRQQQRMKLELGRALTQPVLGEGLEEQLPLLAGEGATAVAIYSSGEVVWCSRWDLALAGKVPWMPPAEAHVRAVRGWREPVVSATDELAVFAAVESGEEPVVVTVQRVEEAARGEPSPREWFGVTGALAALLGLVTARRLGVRLAGPLRRLVDAARRLEEGERIVAIGTGGDEDVATLSHAFTSMAATVQRREEELRRERDLLERVLGTLSAAVLVSHTGGGIELANEAAHRLLGEPPRIEALPRLFGSELDAMLEGAASGSVMAGTLHPVEEPESVWHATVLPLAGLEGRILVVMEDLSEVARAERLASLAELARIAAHEIKNPLTPIGLWAEELRAALARDPADVVLVAETASQQILERVAHLREVAQGFSNLVAMEHWEPERVALAELARVVVAEYTVLAQRGITVSLGADESATVLADPQWLRRAIRHLLENSVRAIGAHGGRVEMSVRQAPREVTLTVRDDGGGVAEEHLGKLFEPHFSTTSEGTGLGLAVVQRVMARAGGRAEARNREGGLEVCLAFPRPLAWESGDVPATSPAEE